MSYTFVNRPAVSLDIISAVNYYKSINPQLAKQFLFRIREAKTYIVKFPFGFPIKYKEVRTLLPKQFHYFIHEDKKQIIVLTIIHAYKNPADYSGR
ncbi:type II toxin-antitoxin system RelE/ParE family toxin [Mucilaginibacter arboris]|uniref:Type II toxin-antitoxin system RelE/ParE family toxin n=1 Tax=Mucilaginibacter arboris TaxID=2682090 RepID=A0A7K1SV51_9SPHI|nr:type II toxin-antitoxin system RelE/ParE family toxin [Mucilaginibacter arboris]MVN21163.1 type II toxin-antitoxin system RelE/ParE family toxin [Mucilaginibacter arboris]